MIPHGKSTSVRSDTSMQPLRVLRIIASVDRANGGPVEGLIQSVTSPESFGQVTEVVSLDPPYAPQIAGFPAPVHGMGPTPKRYGYTSRLSRWITANRHRFDVAVIHGLWNHASVGGWWGCRNSDLPYVLFTHGMMDPWFRKAYPLKHFAKQAFWLVQGRVLRDASEVLFTSEEECRLAKGVFWGYPYRPRVVAYAAGDAALAVPGEEESFRSMVPNLKRSPYLLFLSRIHEKKGCDLLLQGFAQSVRRPELQLVMAGPSDGDLAVRLQAQAKDLGIAKRVHWPGMVKGAAKAGAFRGAEAFALTSHQENFGIAVAEALAYGKPVLITNKVNIWREIKDNQAGLVEADTIEGAALLISQWEEMSDDHRVLMGEAARHVYETHFTVGAAALDLAAALNRAVESKRMTS